MSLVNTTNSKNLNLTFSQTQNNINLTNTTNSKNLNLTVNQIQVLMGHPHEHLPLPRALSKSQQWPPSLANGSLVRKKPFRSILNVSRHFELGNQQWSWDTRTNASLYPAH